MAESTTARTRAKKAAADAAESEDFAAFWGKAKRKEGKRLDNVYGQPVILPPSLPLEFEVASKTMTDSQDPEDVKYLVGLLFGPGELDRWTAAGMDNEQFAVMLLWGTVNAQGGEITLGKAREVYLEAEESGTAPDIASAVGNGKTPAPKTGPAASGRKRAPARRGG